MERPIVVADIGASSSRWAWWKGDGQVHHLPADGEAGLPGFNPLRGDGRSFGEQLHKRLSAAGGVLKAGQVHVYGAGCGDPVREARLHDVLAPLFTHAEVSIASDLLGAARGLLDRDAGLVLILGTGMNAGFFDGRMLHTPMPSLGYLLGDEGSGADIGRHLLREALYGRLPEDLLRGLFGDAGPDLQHVLGEVYGAVMPAPVLARRTAALAQQLHHPVARDLIASRFDALADVIAHSFTTEQRARVVATGSVAHGLSDLLRERLALKGMELQRTRPDPLEGLVAHHRRAR